MSSGDKLHAGEHQALLLPMMGFQAVPSLVQAHTHKNPEVHVRGRESTGVTGMRASPSPPPARRNK